MIRCPFRSTARRLPLGRDDARPFAPWLMALMVYVASLAGIGLLMVDDLLRDADDQLASRLTVQVPADASAARIQTILAVLRQTAGIRSVHLLTPSETGRLLEPWLGAPVPVDELPVPRLIDVAIDRGQALDMATLKQQLVAVVPELRLDDHRPYLGGLHGSARPLQGLLGAAIGTALLLVGLLAVFMTRAALTARRSDVELLHLLGAADRDIARPHAMRSLLHALLGGMIGTAAVLATLAALDGGAPPRLAAPVAAIGWGDWRLWAILTAVAVAAGIIAAASAWTTVLRRLRRMP